jgi:hypothetical protein
MRCSGGGGGAVAEAAIASVAKAHLTHLERMALQPLSQLTSGRQVTRVDRTIPREQPHREENRRVLVHPRAGHPSVVAVQDCPNAAVVRPANIYVLNQRVLRRAEAVELTVDVTDVGAWDNLNGPTAHPHPQRQVNVLASVIVDFWVVLSEFEEELAIHGEQPAGHHWTPHWRFFGVGRVEQVPF